MSHIIGPDLTSRQYQIIVGTILGGSSIVHPKKGKNCYLSMRNKDVDWLRHKANELSEFSSDKCITYEKTNRWHSICYPIFNKFETIFYKDGERNIDIEELSLLKDLAFAVWFKDCGKYDGYNLGLKAVFNTNIWGKKNSEIIQEYFQIIGYNTSLKEERKKFRLVLDEDSTIKFNKLIKPHYYYGKNTI